MASAQDSRNKRTYDLYTLIFVELNLSFRGKQTTKYEVASSSLSYSMLYQFSNQLYWQGLGMWKLHRTFPLLIDGEFIFKRLMAVWSSIKTYMTAEATKINQWFFVNLIGYHPIGNAFPCLWGIVLYNLANTLKSFSYFFRETGYVIVNCLSFCLHMFYRCHAEHG